MKKYSGIILMLFGIILINILVVSSQSFSTSYGSYRQVNSQYYEPSLTSLYSQQDIATYWPILVNKDEVNCYGRKDFLINMAPAGCEPAVVRSDLLEEQNVPVFCRLQAVRLNPLVNANNIDRIVPSIQGSYPEGISGVGYYPARAALRSYDNLLGSPLLNDVGYLVVVLKRNEVEKNMPDYIAANLTAVLKYDLGNAWGVGRGEYYLPVVDDATWQLNYQEYSFWRGKGFLRVDSIDGDNVKISVYSDASTKINSLVLKKGATSNNIYLPGFYCLAAMQLRVDDITSPELSAVVQVNDDLITLRKGSRFYNDQCYVSNIESYGGSAGKVDISCGSERRTLLIEQANVNLQIDKNMPSNYAIGALVKSSIDSKGLMWNYYLAYAGSAPSSASQNKEQFAVIVKTLDSNSKYQNATVRKIIDDKAKSIAANNRIRDLNSFTNEFNKDNAIGISGYSTHVLIAGSPENYDGISILSSSVSDNGYGGTKSSTDQTTAGSNIENYFKKAIQYYREIASSFPSERDESRSRPFGEIALVEAANLAGYLLKQQTEVGLWRELLVKYPNSDSASEAKSKVDMLSTLVTGGSDTSISSTTGTGIYLRLQSIKTVSESESGVQVSYTSPDNSQRQLKTLTLGDYVVKQDSDSKTPVKYKNYISAKAGTNADSVIFDYDCTEKVTSMESGNVRTSPVSRRGVSGNIKEGEHFQICGYDFWVEKLNVKKVAKVVIIPNIQNAESSVNFSVKIGIEKRGIQLSTDKTKEMISNLNDTIKKWESINKNLGTAVEGLKAACFATSAFLQAKTLLEGFSGKSMARSMIMRGNGGWTQACTNAVSTGKVSIGNTVVAQGNYASVDDCLKSNSDKIESSVNYMSQKINEQNERIKSLESAGQTTYSMFGEKIVDTAAYKKGEINSLMGLSQNGYSGKVYDSEGKNGILQSDVLKNINQNTGQFLSIQDMKDIEMYNSILMDSGAPNDLKKNAETNLNSVLSRVSKQEEVYLGKDRGALANSLGIDSSHINYINLPGASTQQYYGDTWGKYKSKISGVEPVSDNTPISIVSASDGSQWLYVLSQSGNKYSPVNKNNSAAIYKLEQVGEVYKATNINTALPLAADTKNTQNSQLSAANQLKNLNFQKFDSSTYKNPFKTRPEVKYWETDPYKGLPAFVPIDLQNGWYAATEQTLPSFGNVKSFDNSGRVTSFYLCNIGSNRIPEFESGMGDDICEMINLQTGQPLNVFPGLTSDQASQLVKKAQKAITDAASQYEAGKKKVNILGESYDVGMPATGKIGTQCQDFMSPDDCYLLFNVCDPVICPSSRCNLGGNYYVSDVVQSGIIGSIALCLPNIREGIYVPVCLTGIHAGIEGYLSILRAHRDCLQESLISGKHIGICDEMYSIYLCEFFWRQVAPVLDIIIPKMIALAYGQGTRGGGEYLTVQSAWDNMQKSVDYFTTYYASNAMKNFQIRSTENIGTTVCKAFISTGYPKLKLLLEPDSPVQFSAWFSETAFTSATVPATSQYNVFYHIYSGKDSGTYYSVYLSNPPGTSFYATIPSVTVATGYIQAGQYADETKQFTAPAGYRQLCVRINDQEKCGFKQVSSDFAVNYAQDLYLSEQAGQAITTQKDCISGTPSVYTALNPNLQAGLEETAMPQLYNRGITRICSTSDPGKTSEAGRWKDVGYCDNAKLRCWVDTKDVKDNILAKDLKNQTLQQIQALNANNALVANGSDTMETTSGKITSYTDLINSWDRIYSKTATDWGAYKINQLDNELVNAEQQINQDIERALYNIDKVKLMMMRAKMFDKAVRYLFDYYGGSLRSGSSVSSVSSASSGIASSSGGIIDTTYNSPYAEGKMFVVYLSEDNKYGLDENDKLNYYDSINNKWVMMEIGSLIYNQKTSTEKAGLIKLKQELIQAKTESSEDLSNWEANLLEKYEGGDIDLRNNVAISMKKNPDSNAIVYRYDGEAWNFNLIDKTTSSGIVGYVKGVIQIVKSVDVNGGYVTIPNNKFTKSATLSTDANNKKMAENILNSLKV